MAFKLIESAQTRWRAVNAPHLVALVRAGAVFKNGKLIERPDESEGGDQQVASQDLRGELMTPFHVLILLILILIVGGIVLPS